MDNYEKQVYTGRELFLKYNQDKLIEKYGLKHDEEYLYLKYIETEYRINRRNGAIEYATGEEWTDCREYMKVLSRCISAEGACNSPVVPYVNWEKAERERLQNRTIKNSLNFIITYKFSR